jgi:NAD(P)-dependent dehydrogenase (short-subunit alcohol dehydrogenase family)
VNARFHIIVDMSALFAPMRWLVRSSMSLTLCPYDLDCGVAEQKTIEELAHVYKGKHVLCIGGTKGIGKATADVIRAAGGSVTVVGRSAVAPGGISADLSTVKGCDAFEKQLVRLGIIFDFVLFTVGVWPSATDAHTAEGIHKVFSIDLVSRHCVMSSLVRNGLVSQSVRVMSVLASCQKVPFDKPSLKLLLSDGMRPDGVTGLLKGFQLMIGTAVAADAWLQFMQRTLGDDAHVMGTFPGLLNTDLAASTFPAWGLQVFKFLAAPMCDSEETCGLNHASILASPNAGRKRVSYWFAPRLEAVEPHPLTQDAELVKWLSEELEKLRAGKTGEGPSSTLI